MYLHQLHNTVYVSSPLYKRVLFIQTESEAAIENASKDEAQRLSTKRLFSFIDLFLKHCLCKLNVVHPI